MFTAEERAQIVAQFIRSGSIRSTRRWWRTTKGEFLHRDQASVDSTEIFFKQEMRQIDMVAVDNEQVMK